MEPFLDPRLRSILHDIARLDPESYVVGGAIRDGILGNTAGKDLDLAIGSDGYNSAIRISELHDVTFVPLNDTHGSGRLVLKAEDPITIDVSSFKGVDIISDLANRDFTINALALKLEDFLNGNFDPVIDPTGGIPDLNNKIIRMCSENSYEDDPLRILRAFRFMACLNFDVDRCTLAGIANFLPALSSVAPERIRDELIAALSAESSFRALKLMDETGVLDELFPELKPMRGCGQNEFHHLDVREHSMEAVRQMELIVENRAEMFGPFADTVDKYVHEEPVKGRPRVSLLKIAALFHDSGKPASKFVEPGGRIRFFGHEKISGELVQRTAEGLKLARKETAFIRDLVEGHMRPIVFTGGPVSDRAVRRLHRRFRRDIVALFLLFLADLAASRGEARTPDSEQRARDQVIRALGICVEAEKSVAQPFINGHDLMELFGMQPGPELGTILNKLKELQELGDITNKQQAVEAAGAMLKKGRSDGWN